MEGPVRGQVPNPDGARFKRTFMNNLSFLTAATTTTTSSSTSSSSSSLFLVVIIGLVAAFYFLMIRPNQRRRMQAMRESRAFDLGDEVVAGGMVGHVVRIGDNDVDVEVSDGVVITFVKQAVQSHALRTPLPGLGASEPAAALAEGAALVAVQVPVAPIGGAASTPGPRPPAATAARPTHTATLGLRTPTAPKPKTAQTGPARPARAAPAAEAT